MVEIAPTRKNWKEPQPNPFRVLFPEVTAWSERGAPVRTIWIYVVLAALAFFLYLPAVWHDFVALGDHDYVRDNPHVATGFTAANILWAFRTGDTGLWQPLTWLSHMRDCQFFETTAGWHHLNNILLHVVNTVLLLFVLNWFTGERWRAAFVAAIFAVHPLNVETVAWIAERKDLLGTFFFLLGFLAYGQYLERRGTAAYLLLVLVFALGLMASPIVIAFPLALFLFDYWPLRYFEMGIGWRRNLYEKLPLIGLSLLAAAVTFFVHKKAGVLSVFDTVPRMLRAENALTACARYLGKIAWPANLYIPYRYSETYDIATLSIAAIILVAISAAVLFLRRTKPYLFTGWFWFLGTLLPVLGLAQIGAHAMADRYTYIPAIGIFIGATWFCADLLAGWRVPRTVIGWICALIISLCVIKTSFQLPHWENTETLLKHTLQLDPKNYFALESLGDEFGRQKRTNDEMDCFARVLKINPNRPFTRANAGLVLETSGYRSKAAVQYETALRSLTPAVPFMGKAERSRAADVANNLAWIRATALESELRNGSDAIKLAKNSIEWSGGQADAVQLDTLAAAEAENGQFDSAVKNARQALDLAKATKEIRLATQIERHLSVYQMGQPFREFPQ